MWRVFTATMESRITLTTVFTGPIKGMKRLIKEFLKGRSTGCVLQTTMIQTGQEIGRMTLLIIEGEEQALYETRDILILHLTEQFPEIQYSEWKKDKSNQTLFAQNIKQTHNSISAQSSGANIIDGVAEIEKTTNEGPFINESLFNIAKATGSYITNIFNQTAPVVVEGAQFVGKVKEAYSRASSFTDDSAKNVWFSYNEKYVKLDIRFCIEWSILLQLVQTAFNVDSHWHMEIYEDIKDGRRGKIVDITGIETSEHYIVKAWRPGQKLTFSTMEEFFEKLQTEQEFDEDDVQIVKDCFANQKIKFKQLMATGDLAMTDGELEKCGIAQLGLRKAILEVIKINMQ